MEEVDKRDKQRRSGSKRERNLIFESVVEEKNMKSKWKERILWENEGRNMLNKERTKEANERIERECTPFV